MKKILLFGVSAFLCSTTLLQAYTDNDVANAQYLARQSLINPQTVTSQFRLDDTILRQEVIGIALKIQGTSLPENYTCKKYFKDATHNDWVCRALELAADNGLISRVNTYARPADSITRAEALAILLKTGKVSLSTPRRVTQSDGSVWSLYQDLKSLGFTQWQADMMDSLPDCSLVNHGDSCEDGASTNTVFARFNPNTLARRGEVFEFAALMMGFNVGDTVSDTLDELETLLNILPKNTQDNILTTSALKKFIVGEALATTSSSPKIALITFSDLECPFCARFETDVLFPLWTDAAQDILFIYKHFPLSFHENAYVWAQESECVRKNVGDEAFFAYIHNRFLSPEASLATLSPDLTIQQIDACKSDEGIDQTINNDQQLGSNYQVSGTPTTLVVNLKTGYYEVVIGAQSRDFVEGVIKTVKEH